MSLNLRDRKKKREEMRQKVQSQEESGGGKADGRIWRYSEDKEGTAIATMRLLPYDDNKAPYVQKYVHNFVNDRGDRVALDCPTTWGDPCPICEQNQKDYKVMGDEERKQILSPRYRIQVQWINALILDDQGDASNNGKLKIFSYRKKIHDSIMNGYNGDPKLGEEPKELFDVYDAHNFRFVKLKDGKYPDYSKCKVADSPTDLTEEQIDYVSENIHDLSEFIDKDKCIESGDLKSYDYIKDLFEGRISTQDGSADKVDNKPKEEVKSEAKSPKSETKEAPKTEAKAEAPKEESKPAPADDKADESNQAEISGSEEDDLMAELEAEFGDLS